jgi:uncharacterized protein with HEPN domain
VRGMRNQIVHGYYQVDPMVVWDTSRTTWLPLVELLNKMLAER